jgi:hypothetical protein
MDKRKNVGKYIEKDGNSFDQKPSDQKKEANNEKATKISKYSEKKETAQDSRQQTKTKQ